MQKRMFIGVVALLVIALAGSWAYVFYLRVATPAQAPLSTVSLADELDPAVWGKLYPQEYSSFMRNQEQTKSPSVYGGSVPNSHLKEYPYMTTLWSGYSFAKEYNEDRGHWYTMEDVTKTARAPAKAVCLTCKSASVPKTIAKYGKAYYSMSFQDVQKEMKYPIGCSDCHDPKTMELRITRPALVEALAKKGINVTKASRQEMRSLVCAQCHVEYYFTKDDYLLTFPWTKGFDPENEYAYYQEIQFTDWEHGTTKTPMLKAQHPDFEMFQGGTHQANGVACADCHMPFVREGNMKVTSHWITSPLKHMEQSCGVCHGADIKKLTERVQYTQDKVEDLLNRSGNELAEAIKAIETAAKVVPASTDLARAREMHREGQWYWDWVGAENSHGFHNPQKALTTLAKAIDLAHQATEAALRASLTATSR